MADEREQFPKLLWLSTKLPKDYMARRLQPQYLHERCEAKAFLKPILYIVLSTVAGGPSERHLSTKDLSCYKKRVPKNVYDLIYKMYLVFNLICKCIYIIYSYCDRPSSDTIFSFSMPIPLPELEYRPTQSTNTASSIVTTNSTCY